MKSAGKTNRILFFILIFTLASSFSVWADSDHVPGRILIKPGINADTIEFARSLKTMGVSVEHVSTAAGLRIPFSSKSGDFNTVSYLIAEFDKSLSPELMAQTIGILPGVDVAVPDYKRRLLFTPDDPYYEEYQGNFVQIGMERVWNVTFGSPDIVVAVLDTGYRFDELTDSALNLVKGLDFYSGESGTERDDDPTDYYGHGTLVTNVIAQATDNGIGAAGMAPEVTILVVKIFPDGEGGAADSDIIDAVNYAVDNGAHIINMSFGGGDDNPLLEQVMIDAKAAGVFLIAATGNDGESKIMRPSNYDSVFAVGSCGDHPFGSYPTPSKFSNHGDGLDIVAPGEAILQEGYTEDNGVNFYSAYGTSMSAPHVSAAAALMLTLGGMSDPNTIAQALRDSAVQESDTWTKKLGWGELDVPGAIALYHEPLPNSAPIAGGTAAAETGIAPDTVTFSAANSSDPDGNIVSYQWVYGQEQPIFGDNVQMEFDAPGEYSVILTVTDAEGESDTAVVTFSLDKAPERKVEEEDSGCGCDVNGSGGSSAGALMLLIIASAILFAKKALAPVRIRIQRSRFHR